MAGNVILGIIGLAVDANSGATQDLVPNPLTVHLESAARCCGCGCGSN
ncbi:MAG: hypothetical protein IPG56_12760 [Caulobacteraceae bacterium]|nr:hypothetical protein [Caulobacteraceae bacterium]